MSAARRAVAITLQIGRASEFACTAFKFGYWELARRMRGRPTLYTAAGSQTRATSVKLCLSLWGLTEGQPTSPLLLHLLLPRLQLAGFILHTSPGKLPASPERS